MSVPSAGPSGAGGSGSGGGSGGGGCSEVVQEAPATPAPAMDAHDDSQGKHSDSNTQVESRPPVSHYILIKTYFNVRDKYIFRILTGPNLP